MLVRGRKNSLNFVEASESTGVIVYPIRQLFEDGSNDVVVYRKLMYKLDEEAQGKFKRRLIEIIGKKYHLNMWNLWRKYSVRDSIKQIPKDKGYFCSELVAALYKFLEILPPEICSSHYWPGSFSTETELKLINGARLGPECIIEF
eukprot:TRINITY_DN12834_c0_g2_i10.p2 TRINITY_DN12834_c0_g2~~TRINITY_DN12834_c0_g2_i10.p2  ORF type:complete len:146 (+),score=35.79 TRINITY_DN12834_c0_g2_i10:989-1426(+)